MAAKNVMAICQSGGKFERKEDGSLSYIFDVEQLEAHLLKVNNDTKVSTFKEDVSKRFRGSPEDAVSAKYFFPNHKYTPITISKDADLQSLVECYENISVPVNVFITIKKPPPAPAPAADPAVSTSTVQPVEIPGTNELTTQKMLVVTPPKKRPRNPECQRGLVVTPPKKRRHCSSCQGRGHDKRNCKARNDVYGARE